MHLKSRLILVGVFLFTFLPGRAAWAATQDDLKNVLDRLNVSAANFRSVSANVEFDNIETDPVPETDVQKGVVYYNRKNNSVQMGVHMSEHNGKPSGKAYTYVGGVFKLFEPGVNQVTTFVKASKWESYIDLGFGASGNDLQAKWDIKYLGSEQMGGVNTAKLELTPKDPDLHKNLSKVTIWVDPDHAVSLKQVFNFNNSTYVCTYSDFKFNQSLPADAFKFKTNGQTVYQNQ
ncbi:MAG: LolA family protein [Terracidiphilus sp.]